MSIGNLSPVVRQQAWSLGVVSPGAKLYTYLSGTTTPQVVYLDAARLTPASNPLVADANGRFAAFWLASVAYRMTLTDSADVVIWGPEDGITNAISDLGANATGTTLTLTGGLTLGSNATITGDLALASDPAIVRRTTSDGGDTGTIEINGGGASGISRGALVLVHGNEHASLPGKLQLYPGNVSGGIVEIYRQDGTLALSIDSSGTTILAYGQVKFPATQNPSTDVNTLDDYEEGSFTPAFGGSGGQSGQVYSSQTGRYIKVGRLVVVTGAIFLTTVGTITTNLLITGLPFTVVNIANQLFVGGVMWQGMAGNFVNIVLDPIANTTTAAVRGAAAAASNNTGPLAQADLTTSTVFTFTLSYFATA